MHIAFISNNYENLGIEYISSFLKRAGHKTSLIFEPGLFGSFFLHNNNFHRWLNFDKAIIGAVKGLNPDIVAFSVISDNYSWAVGIAKRIKQENEGVTIVFGGIHPTSVPEYVMQNDFVDFSVVGEGEEAMVELANALEKHNKPIKIPNLAFREDGKIKINKVRPPLDLNALPFPDKDLFFNEYEGMVSNSYMILGSRGCVYNCSYCWNTVINKIYPSGIYFRRRSAENIIKELLWAKERYGIKRVTFYDEIFTLDKLWLKQLLSLYQEKIRLPFFCCVHPSNCDEDVIGALTDAGCSTVNIGIQTIDANTRKVLLNRPENNTQIIKSIQLLRKTNIFVYSNIMLGIPGQDEKELLDNLYFCNRYKIDIPATYWLRYYPKTKIIDILKEKSLLSGEVIKNIESGAIYSPYAMHGSTYNKEMAKIGNLILMSGIIPCKLMDIIIKYRLYRFLPSRNLLFPLILGVAIIKKFMQNKKFAFHYLSAVEYMHYYIFYLRRLLAEKACLK
ncbi:MAG: radical SAM protein [Candidatus Omnitrophota bacterium]